MGLDAIKNYPDYLQDFEDINVLAAKQSSLAKLMCSMVKRRVEDILATGHFLPDYWKEVVRMKNYALDKRKLLHKKYPTVSVEELKQIMLCWFSESSFTLDFDAEELTFTFKTTVGQTDKEKYYPCVRNVLPCNCKLVWERVEKIE